MMLSIASIAELVAQGKSVSRDVLAIGVRARNIEITRQQRAGEPNNEDHALRIGIGAALAAQPRALPETWRPMETAPRDGTMLRLLVQFEEHATEDTIEPAPTIGAYEEGAESWQFAGWCWTHDHFTEGKGEPVGWLPMLDLALLPGEPA
jgi:hypothetical protein